MNGMHFVFSVTKKILISVKFGRNAENEDKLTKLRYTEKFIPLVAWMASSSLWF